MFHKMVNLNAALGNAKRMQSRDALLRTCAARYLLKGARLPLF